MENYILSDISNDIKFTKRATPIPLGARLSYRIAQICLILGLCCKPQESCSIQKIQTISNALFQPQEFEKLVRYSKLNSAMEFTPRIDPCVNSAIEFAIKYGLCKQTSTHRRYKLTELGKKYFAAIYADEIMENEKAMLLELGASFTEKMIDEICN